jgi:hypothetical protein
MQIEIIPHLKFPALLESCRLKSLEWSWVAERLLDSKRGDWIRILLQEVPGNSLKNKQGIRVK